MRRKEQRMQRKIRRAILSVTDKSGLVSFAQKLQEFGVEILSTGGTARQLREAGLSVVDISEFTGFPEMLDGRVKTLHPKVHAGILAQRDNSAHMNTMASNHLKVIDMVVVNLYAFEKTVAREDCTLEDVQYHLYVLQKIDRGLKDAHEGRVHTQEEVEAMMAKWLEE